MGTILRDQADALELESRFLRTLAELDALTLDVGHEDFVNFRRSTKRAAATVHERLSNLILTNERDMVAVARIAGREAALVPRRDRRWGSLPADLRDPRERTEGIMVKAFREWLAARLILRELAGLERNGIRKDNDLTIAAARRGKLLVEMYRLGVEPPKNFGERADVMEFLIGSMQRADLDEAKKRFPRRSKSVTDLYRAWIHTERLAADAMARDALKAER